MPPPRLALLLRCPFHPCIPQSSQTDPMDRTVQGLGRIPTPGLHTSHVREDRAHRQGARGVPTGVRLRAPQARAVGVRWQRRDAAALQAPPRPRPWAGRSEGAARGGCQAASSGPQRAEPSVRARRGEQGVPGDQWAARQALGPARDPPHDASD